MIQLMAYSTEKDSAILVGSCKDAIERSYVAGCEKPLFFKRDFKEPYGAPVKAPQPASKFCKLALLQKFL